MSEKPEALQVQKGPVGRSGTQGTEESSVVIAETPDHREQGDSNLRDSLVEENNEHSPIPDMPNKVGTVDATLAGSSLFLLMMYKVIKHIFNKYYHFMLICILHYPSMLLVKNYYIFKYSYFFYR
ncbi:hypothetical protein PVMG_05821 [Plasmodium vivax Mauritania I]|uniref:Uncharacterized protein n=1 Tax=Plasmodium vivax Mauritania I TaxID=1035515 RepID=A0A0J9THK1_PLAVI|nr:hypothetical protein PVMG_05939 [Plasmodium vivax Mauritania I]KMZ95677.1 hypothetical protein PVMG_05821 [Plasmodium vivax Mauritania I]